MAIFNTIYVKNTQKDAGWYSPEMTSNNEPSPFIASANSEYTSSSLATTYYAYRAFDGEDTTSWYSNFPSSWLQLDFGKQTSVNAIAMTPDFVNFAPNYLPKQVTISGSNDGSTWKDIITDNGDEYNVSKGTRIIEFGSLVTYRYYKFSFGPAYNGQDQSIVGEIKFRMVTA